VGQLGMVVGAGALAAKEGTTDGVLSVANEVPPPPQSPPRAGQCLLCALCTSLSLKVIKTGQKTQHQVHTVLDQLLVV